MDDSQKDLYWEKEDDKKKSQYNVIPFKQVSCHLRIVGWARVGGRDYKVMNFCG